MRAMKDSGIEWIGQIPQEWGTIRAKYVTTITNGSDPKTEGDIPVYGSGSGCFKTCGEYKEGPTVLLGRKGTVDIPQYITGNYWNVDTAFDVKTVEEQLDLEFYYFASTCFDYKYYTSTTTLPSMTQTNYGNMCIPFPPVDVQRRVVVGLKEKLSGIDALIAAKEKTNALLKERRQSIIYEAVTKGLNPDAPMKDSGVEWIGQIPEHWGVGKLGYFIEAFNGDRSSNYPSGNDIQDSGVPFLTSSNLERDVLDMSNSKYISEEKYKSMSGLKMELDDIIYCLRGSVGKCAINKTETCGTVASSLMGIRCKKMIPDYLLFLLKSSVIETQNALFMNGTCAANLSAENVCGYLVPIPNETEQRTIAEYLQGRCSEMDELISANEATIQKLKEYRQSIIYEAVTGKIEI